MGTPEFAVASLHQLHQSEIEVAAVVSAADKPAGRGRKLSVSAVKQYALENNIPVLQPEKLRDPAFIEELEKLNAELFVVVAFRMLPKMVWNLPELGTINLHASLLPDYRGAAPINWAIINGEKESGVTTFFINEKIDTGDLLLQEKVSIHPEANAGDLHDKLMDTGAALLLKTVRGLAAGTLEARPQPMDSSAKEAPKLNKDNTRIDFNQSTDTVSQIIRGLSPYPAAHTTLHRQGENLLCKIYAVKQVPGRTDLKPGELHTDNRSFLHVGCQNGLLEVTELQLEGKKRMNSKDLLNGFSFEENDYFG